jgi:CAAX protease family protein
MGKLRLWIGQHLLLSFVLIAFGLSWGLWAIMIAVWGQISWLGSFGPSLSALIVVALAKGRRGLADLLRPCLKARFGVGWYAFILPGCVLLLLVGVWAYMIWGGPMPFPRDAVLNQLTQVPLYYVIVLIIGGPLGEEIGWRGHLLPGLLRQGSAVRASLIVCVIWFAWHLPLFWLPGASQRGASIAAYALFIAAWSVLFTWVYIGTSGSLLSALLLHASINTFSLVLSGIDPTYSEAPVLAQAVVSAVFAALVIAVDRRMTRPYSLPASSPVA